MTLLDSGAIIGALLGEPCTEQVATILRSPDDGIASIAAVTVAEVIDRLVRRGLRVDACDNALELLFAGGLVVHPSDAETGRLAGLLRARHWDPVRRPVSLADCVILASAMLHEESLATGDRALVGAARAEGHPVIPVRDSSGRMPA